MDTYYVHIIVSLSKGSLFGNYGNPIIRSCLKRETYRGALLAQSVEHLTLNFDPGHDPRVIGQSFVLGSTLSKEPAWDPPSLSLCPSPPLTSSPSLYKIKKEKQNKNRKRLNNKWSFYEWMRFIICSVISVGIRRRNLITGKMTLYALTSKQFRAKFMAHSKKIYRSLGYLLCSDLIIFMSVVLYFSTHKFSLSVILIFCLFYKIYRFVKHFKSFLEVLFKLSFIHTYIHSFFHFF